MRRHYLDNIRWVTVLLVVLYHVIFMYNGIGLAVGTLPVSEGSHYRDAVLYLLYPWFMLILFIVAGVSSRLYLEKHTVKEFVRSRTDKLLVPSTLGVLAWGWAQGYVSMKMSELTGGAVDLAQAPAPIRYLILCLSGTSVLWFAQLLWFFSIVLALIRKLEKGKLYELCKKANFPVMLLLGAAVFGAGFLFNTPMITVYRFGYYGIGFLLGYFVFAHEEVIDRLRRYRFVLAPSALALGILYTVMYFGQNYADASAHIEVINSVPAVLYAWAAVLAIFACAKEWGNVDNSVTRFMTKRSFGMYVFHFFGISGAALLLYMYTDLPVAVRCVIVGIAGLLAGFVLPEIIGRIPVLRYLILGIRKKRGKAKIAEKDTA